MSAQHEVKNLRVSYNLEHFEFLDLLFRMTALFVGFSITPSPCHLVIPLTQSSYHLVTPRCQNRCEQGG